jgi:DNA-directed RNA polymerase subunit RPC12/RpoP
MSTPFELDSRCTRCRRAIGKVWIVRALANHCPYCGHPVLPPERWAAAKAVSRMNLGRAVLQYDFDKTGQLIKDMIAEYEAGLRPKP